MQTREDILVLQEKVEHLAARVDAMETEVECIQQELQQQAAANSADRSRTAAAFEQRVADLEKTLARLEKERAADRQAIIDQLSRKIAELLRKSGSAPTGRRVNRGSDYGYEHVVKAGETLSEIAAAYGVTVRSIVEANDIPNPDRLRVGQKLFIPE